MVIGFKVFGVPSGAPLQLPEYHLTPVPLPPVAVRVIKSIEYAQKLLLSTVIVVGGVGKGLMVSVAALLIWLHEVVDKVRLHLYL